MLRRPWPHEPDVGVFLVRLQDPRRLLVLPLRWLVLVVVLAARLDAAEDLGSIPGVAPPNGRTVYVHPPTVHLDDLGALARAAQPDFVRADLNLDPDVHARTSVWFF